MTNQPKPRLACVGEPHTWIHAPESTDHVVSAFFAVAPRGDPGGQAGVAGELEKFAPDVTVIFDPHLLEPRALQGLPGDHVVFMLGRPLVLDAEVTALRERAQAFGKRVVSYSYFDATPSPAVARLAPLRVFPFPVARRLTCLPQRQEVRRACFAEWASPPPAFLGDCAVPLDRIDAQASLGDQLAALQGCDALVYWSRLRLGQIDRLPLLALAAGLLVISNREFVPSWEIEPLDEYLPVRDEREALQRIAWAAAHPELVQPIRIRAAQKVREAFTAEDAFARLLTDLDLLTPTVGEVPAPATITRDNVLSWPGRR